MTRFTIGQAAKAANVNVETVRFYERRGLISQPLKPAGGGAREYSAAIVANIRFVRQAQQIGFSLREILELLSLRARPGADCADVRSRAIEKRDEVQSKLEQLARMRNALDKLIASCPGGGDVKACTILDAMQCAAELAHWPAVWGPSTIGEESCEMKTTVLAIHGMHCDGCARTIEALLARVPGVQKAEASFDEHRARVLHDQDRAPDSELIAAIAKGGFQATPDSR